ncbi:hypothetical protein [Bifidobacterium longum]|uniref:hypothetical protein n=1 Tax=Bifidobacterium longum TaxID=216816 RepID=UPI00374E7418
MPQNITLADLTKSSATPITNPLLNTNQAAPNTTLVPTAAEAQAAAALTPDQQIAKLPEADQATVNQMAGQIDFTRDGIESSYGKTPSAPPPPSPTKSSPTPAPKTPARRANY